MRSRIAYMQQEFSQPSVAFGSIAYPIFGKQLGYKGSKHWSRYWSTLIWLPQQRDQSGISLYYRHSEITTLRITLACSAQHKYHLRCGRTIPDAPCACAVIKFDSIACRDILWICGWSLNIHKQMITQDRQMPRVYISTRRSASHHCRRQGRIILQQAIRNIYNRQVTSPLLHNIVRMLWWRILIWSCIIPYRSRVVFG